uniref:Putative ovule protein n=1 Tax=Solanum chacoense TaxID=4108 RepID=A0A0V0H036_SOLCH
MPCRNGHRFNNIPCVIPQKGGAKEKELREGVGVLLFFLLSYWLIIDYPFDQNGILIANKNMGTDLAVLCCFTTIILHS